MGTIKAVLFDYGMVLSGPPESVAWMRMTSLLHANPEAFSTAYWRSRDAYDRGTLSGVAYWHVVADDLRQFVSDKTINALLAEDNNVWAQPNEPMIAWASKLQREGIKTGILSNLGDAMELGIRSRCAWLDAFTHQTFSHRLGLAKPDAAVYAHAADGLGVKTAEILFIDDREENIAAARAIGMAAIRYSNHPSFVTKMKAAGYDWLL